MGPFGEPRSRGARLALVAGALVVLLLVVALASRTGFGGNSKAAPTSSYASYALTVFLILFVLMIPVALYAFLIQMREADMTKRRSFPARMLHQLAVLFLLGAAGFVIVYLKTHNGHLFGIHVTRFQPASTGSASGGHGKHSVFEPKFEWWVLWVALILLVATAIALAVTRTRRPKGMEELPEATDVGDDLAASIGDAIDDLEAEPDARRAVIAAYARMEAVLARHGLRRRASETPVEYLRRILLGLTARADAVARLTDLFELAKFSRHDIDASMKLDAIAALREIRDDLRAAAAA
ncbi:MAG TPA: DUF4129 domain-containing protein [Gaiellaceae bacterium]|nr:DUF4129 domain-containing protein [Gaiellaceae bacterium]